MGFALVMVKEHTGRTVHLGNDHALGAVHDERAVVRHQGHVAHVDVLLFDVADGARARIFVNIPDDETQRHFQRRGECQPALAAFFNIILGGLKFIIHEFKLRFAREITHREHRRQRLGEPLLAALFGAGVNLQERVVGALLDLD